MTEPAQLCEGRHTFIISREIMEAGDLSEAIVLPDDGTIAIALHHPIYDGRSDSFSIDMLIEPPPKP